MSKVNSVVGLALQVYRGVWESAFDAAHHAGLSPAQSEAFYGLLSVWGFDLSWQGW